MLDVDFLREPPTDDGPIVYLCRTGFLVPRFKKEVFALAARLGSSPIEYGPGEITSAGPPHSFFEPIYRYCDWRFDKKTGSARGRAIPKDVGDLITACLSSGLASQITIVLPLTNRLIENPDWPHALAKCRVVDEPLVTASNIGAYLEFFDKESDLAPPGSIVGQQSFWTHFADLGEGQECSVAELSRRFDEVVLTKSEALSNTVRANAADREDEQTHRFALVSVLRELVERQESRALLRLAADLGARRARGWTVLARHRELYRCSAVLLSSSELGTQAVSANPSADAALLWAGLLLAGEEGLRKSGAGGRRVPEVFDLGVDQTAREFLAKASGQDAVDPLAGHWTDIRATLELSFRERKIGLETARRHLLHAVVARGSRSDAGWARQLGVLARYATEHAGTVDDEIGAT